MVKILQLLLVTVFLIIVEIFCSKLIGNILSEYYGSESLKSFREEWVKYREGFESAVTTNLQENYGAKSMNIYVRHVGNDRKITKGFYLSDNIVNVLLTDMVLRDWPNLIMPEVSLCLPGNILKLEATVGKMFVDTGYVMMRNESAVLYSEADLDKTKHSPFSLQQVHREGKLTITAEDCFLSGFSIVRLLGNSVDLGHNTFRLVDCKFTVEISSDVGTPPVIAPYFPKGPGKQIETLLSAPIREELVQILQGAMYSYINTSVIFGSDLSKYKLNQQKLFKQTSTYLSNLCERLNNMTLKEQKGSIALSDFEERLETKTDEKRTSTYLSLKELKLYGLDTAYASLTGGSFEAPQLSIAEGIRFHALQIRGTVFYENETESHTHNFAAELTDVTVNVIVNIEKEGSKSVHKFDVLFAKIFDFSVLPWETGVHQRHWYQALVSGYIINEVPARITEHLSRVLTPATNNEDQEELRLSKENSQSEGSEENDHSERDHEVVELNEAIENKEMDMGVMVTAPEAVLESDNSAGDKKLHGSDSSDFESPVSDYRSLNDKKDLAQSDAVLDTDFFSDDNGKKPFLSDDGRDKMFISDDDGEKYAVKSEGNGDNNPVKSKEVGDNIPVKLEEDAYNNPVNPKEDGDNNPVNPEEDGDNNPVNNEEDGDSNPVTPEEDGDNNPVDNEEDGDNVPVNPEEDGNNNPDNNEEDIDNNPVNPEEDGDNNPVKPEEDGDSNPINPEDDANHNPEISDDKEKKQQLLIFASPENDRNEQNDEIAEQSVQQSVPIERAGKKSSGAVNKKKPTKRIHRRNKKESNNLKLTLRRNPRVNTTKTQVRNIMTLQKVNSVQTSKAHNNTRVIQNEVHMSDNEIR